VYDGKKKSGVGNFRAGYAMENRVVNRHNAIPGKIPLHAGQIHEWVRRFPRGNPEDLRATAAPARETVSGLFDVKIGNKFVRVLTERNNAAVAESARAAACASFDKFRSVGKFFLRLVTIHEAKQKFSVSRGNSPLTGGDEAVAREMAEGARR